MDYYELTRIIADVTTEALKPLREKIHSLKSHENNIETIPTNEVNHVDETDWAMLQLHKYLDYIKKEWTKDNVTLSKMRKLLKRYKPKHWIITKAEKDFYNSLPEYITLYRGGSLKEISSTFGVSWTTEIGTAEHYAYKEEREGRCVYCVVVPKSEIRAIPIPDALIEIMILDPVSVEIISTEPTEAFYQYEEEMERCRQKTKQAIEDVLKLLKF